MTTTPGDAAQLAVAVLDAEAEREAQQAAAQEEVLFATDLLPGVGEEEVSLGRAVRIGGVSTFVVLMLLRSLEELESATLSVLAPDLRHAFGVSNGTIVFLAAASGSFLVLGALPMGWLADRHRRPPIIGWANLAFAGFLALCGAVTNAFQLFWARLGVGVAKSNTYPVQGSMIGDAYPISARGRINAWLAMGSRFVGVLSPVIVAGIAAGVGGDDGWRWPFVLLGFPVAIVALFAFKLKEPPRGQFEKQDVLGEVIEDAQPAPISVEAAFARLWQIRTLKTVIVAFSALGFGLFTLPVLTNLFMEDHYGTDTFDRGVLGTIGGIGVLLVLPFVGKYYDGLYRRDPARALRFVGLTILPAALLTPVQFFMPNVIAFTIVGVPQLILLSIGVHDGAAGPAVGGALPVAGHGLGARVDLHLLHRRDRWRAPLRSAHRRVRFAHRGDRDHGPVDHHRRVPDPARRELHPQRPVARRRRAPGGDGRASAPAGIADGDPGPPGGRHRLLLRCRCRCSSTWASRCGRARCSRCSAPTVPASPRSCAPSPDSARRRAASSGSTVAPSRTRRPSSGRSSASASCSAARACSRP